eukprot:CAMPEP_0114582234 /NCGR_PEP_ID=MMETSP0125-20121206/6257_1 /TAXON_ID=485358 ORGANISM="Aristerostoma sp., Strain ATCC 50986" /NCGR_SAMPLE_ID=MMETSP0125 /ASSEMBLY_ACC=CAM_ASM_000245 /LENGTH=137 /DNA_ID=CAMNT_0001775067 /DNA_START=118 /DNA_END=531 /DNA_ORIENTATION=-
MGKAFESKSVSLKAIKILKEDLGEKNPDLIATIYGNIAQAVRGYGLFKESNGFMKESLKYDSIAVGSFIPDKEECLNIIALTFDKDHKGQLLNNYKQSLNEKSKVFGESHPCLGFTYLKIACIYASMEKKVECLDYF